MVCFGVNGRGDEIQLNLVFVSGTDMPKVFDQYSNVCLGVSRP